MNKKTFVVRVLNSYLIIIISSVLLVVLFNQEVAQNPAKCATIIMSIEIAIAFLLGKYYLEL